VVKPSKPGDFPWDMFLTISSTSSKEVGLIIICDCSMGTNLGIASIILDIPPCLLILGSHRRYRK
jgi:hypothetical protein